MAQIECGRGCGIGQLLQFQFNPWPGNFHMLQVQPRKKKKRERKEKETSEGASLANTFSQDVQSPGLPDSKFLLFSLPVYGYLLPSLRP